MKASEVVRRLRELGCTERQGKGEVGEMTGLKVVFEPDDDGWWSVEIPELKGVRSDGRTLEEARRKIREALASAEDLGWNDKRAATAEFIEDVRLPASIEKLIARRRDALLALEAAASDVEKATGER